MPCDVNSSIIGKAVCCSCGGEVFEVILYQDGTREISCIIKECRAFWPPTIGKARYNPVSNEAVELPGDEPSVMVSETKGPGCGFV